jgi:two-component system, chemotaxis family, sensor kinase CheA
MGGLSKAFLPATITEFEREHVQRINRIALWFFAAHIPVFAAIAYVNRTRPELAVVFTAAIMIGPAIAHRTLDNPRHVALIYGVTAMCMGGLLVHFGQGAVQIEMHFYFFALIAMLAVYGNPAVIYMSALTVALHHLMVWIWVPRSVFNYEASVWVVGVHAVFVILETVAVAAIARSFYDNVIRLERVVDARTREKQTLETEQQAAAMLVKHMVGESSSFIDRIKNDPALGRGQRETLIMIYERFVGRAPKKRSIFDGPVVPPTEDDLATAKALNELG